MENNVQQEIIKTCRKICDALNLDCMIGGQDKNTVKVSFVNLSSLNSIGVFNGYYEDGRLTLEFVGKRSC